MRVLQACPSVNRIGARGFSYRPLRLLSTELTYRPFTGKVSENYKSIINGEAVP